MRLKSSSLTGIMFMVLLLAFPAIPAPAQAGPLFRAVSRWMGKSAARKGAKELAEYAGETVVSRVSRKVVRELGESGLERASQLVSRHGIFLMKHLDDIPPGRLSGFLKAVEDIGEEGLQLVLKRAARSRAAQKALFETVERFGARALRAEMRHPGVGLRLVKMLGDDGIRLATGTSRRAGVAIAQHADDMAALPSEIKKKVMDKATGNPESFGRFLRQFTLENPGKTLFSAAGASLFLVHGDALLGGDKVLEYDEDGNLIRVTDKPGLLGRAVDRAAEAGENIFKSAVLLIAQVLSFCLALYFLVKLVIAGTHSWRLRAAQTDAAIRTIREETPRGERLDRAVETPAEGKELEDQAGI